MLKKLRDSSTLIVMVLSAWSLKPTVRWHPLCVSIQTQPVSAYKTPMKGIGTHHNINVPNLPWCCWVWVILNVPSYRLAGAYGKTVDAPMYWLAVSHTVKRVTATNSKKSNVIENKIKSNWVTNFKRAFNPLWVKHNYLTRRFVEPITVEHLSFTRQW
jgi:hypothetical protein